MSKNTKVAQVKETGVVMFDPANIRKVADIVIPSLSIKSMKENDTLYIRLESEIKYVSQVDEKTGDVKMKKIKVTNEDGTESVKEKEEKLPIVIAVNMVTEQRGQMVLPSIVHRGLEAAGTLTGRTFALQKGASLGTGKANLWEVVEFSQE